jgi:hypothetical protein
MNIKETERRIREAIADCDRYIALESPRSEDLRPAWAKHHLEFCITHKQRLLERLEGLHA